MEKVSEKDHWFFVEEFRWRSIASAVWTWCTNLLILAVFLFGFTLDASNHVFIISDFLGALFSIRTLGICIVMTSLTSLLVRLHSLYYAIAPAFPPNRFELVLKITKVSNIIFLIASVLYSTLITHLATFLISGKYSWDYQCSQSDMNANTSAKLCESGVYSTFILFGFSVGFVSGIDRLLNQRYCLNFLNVQEAKFLSIKCRLPGILYNCAVKGAKIMNYFLIIYYIIAFMMRDVVILSSGMLASLLYSLQIWKIFHVIPVIWNLWLVGTLPLLLWEVSWQFFNIYHTQGYRFLLHPVIPDNQYKLLVENMSESSPPIVQHLTCRYLSLIAKENPSKRRQIFALSHSTENGQPVSWNTILNNCLIRIRRFTSDVTEYQSVLTETNEERICDVTASSFMNQCTERQASANDGSLQPRHCQYLSPVHNISTSSFTDRTLPSVSVPTPRLWTSCTEGTETEGKSFSTTYAFNSEPTQLQNRIRSYADKAIKLPIGSYFFKMVPCWGLRNVYREHLIIKWAMQSLSYLCAASRDEDQFGVVQGCLRDIIVSLIDLLTALENLGKIASSTNAVSKIHLSLCNEIKASLHRIVETFGGSLKFVNLSQEYKARLLTFSPCEG